MATRLMFAAPDLQQKLTDIFWFPHPISFDINEKRWKFVTYSGKLLPFYFMAFFVIPVIGDGSIIVQSYKRFALNDRSVSSPVFYIFITLGFLSLYSWGFNIPLLLYGKSIVAYLNAILDSQLSCPPLKAKSGMKVNKLNQIATRKRLGQRIADVKVSLPCMETDKFGIFLNMMVIYFQLLGFALPIVGIIFEFDPILYFLRDLKLDEYMPPIVFFILRYIISMICVQETTRTATIVIMGSVTAHVVTNRLITILTDRSVSQNTLKMYLKLVIIHRSGDHINKYLFSVFFFAGFVLCVVFNCFTLIGWRLFPVSFYVACLPITLLVHFLIHIFIPMCAECFEITANAIRYKWVSDLGFVGEKMVSNYDRRMLLKIMRSIQPVAFHSGSIATVNYSMRLNYLEYVLGKTVDVLIVFHEQIEHMEKLAL